MRLKDNSLGFIWDILHERGQGLLSKNTAEQQGYAIEKQAWDFAEAEIKRKYPMLEELMDDFYTYRDRCLKAYL